MKEFNLTTDGVRWGSGHLTVSLTRSDTSTEGVVPSVKFELVTLVGDF